MVGSWRDRGRRGLPVNAELDFEPHHERARPGARDPPPARVAGYENARGELPAVMKSIGMRASVAAPVLLGGEVWGALVAGAADEEALPPGSEQRLAGLAELVAQALANDDARAELAASRTRLVQAGDEARRRLERALHEGAHQHVVALALKLRVALGRAEPASESADVLRDAARRRDGDERRAVRPRPRPAPRGAVRARPGGRAAGARPRAPRSRSTCASCPAAASRTSSRRRPT